MEPRNDAVEQSSTITIGSHRLRAARSPKEDVNDTKLNPVHERLDDPSGQIRLLLAAKSSQDDALAFEISTHSLNDAPPYHAISYTWGQDDTQRSVFLKGAEFHVNQNCYYALWQACLHYSETPLWIDSLCIDQDNSAEKSAQVWIMPEIYRGATRVLACIGPHANDSEVLVAMVPEVERLSLSCKPTDQLENVPELVLKSMGLQGFLRLFWAFQAFDRRRYWQRLWIQQEIALATNRDVLCGNARLFWRSVLALYNICLRIFYSRDRWLPKADCIRLNEEAPFLRDTSLVRIIEDTMNPEFTLEHLLLLSQSLDCEDFHDRVYGMLGLARTSIRNHLLPNYDLTAPQLGLQVADLMSFPHVETIFLTLGIDCWDERLRRVVERRCSSEVITDHVAPQQDERCACYSVRAEREREMRAIGATVPIFERLNSAGYQYTVRANSDGELGIDLKSFKALDWQNPFIDKDHVGTQALLADARRIMVNGIPAGFICDAARAGDVILAPFFMLGQKFLVLRHSGGDFFDLIGGGFMTPGFDLIKFQRDLKVWVHISISPEESVAFWTTEFQDREGEEPRRMTDMIARLNSSITTHPHGAVRCRSQSPSREEKHRARQRYIEQ